jgi:hypothetical protein
MAFRASHDPKEAEGHDSVLTRGGGRGAILICREHEAFKAIVND